MTQDTAHAIRDAMIRRGLRRVTPRSLRIVHPDHGEDRVPRAMAFDGATGVRDLCLQCEARHDWAYVVGEVNGQPVTKDWADRMLRDCYHGRGFTWVCWRRYIGLAWFPVTSQLSRRIWERSRRCDGHVRLQREFMLPDPDRWEFPGGSWLLREAVYCG